MTHRQVTEFSQLNTQLLFPNANEGDSCLAHNVILYGIGQLGFKAKVSNRRDEGGCCSMRHKSGTIRKKINVSQQMVRHGTQFTRFNRLGEG